MRTRSRAMSSGGRTKSTQPEAIALWGMPSCWAVPSCANVMPPSAPSPLGQAYRPKRCPRE
jgi:hypothetical protein